MNTNVIDIKILAKDLASQTFAKIGNSVKSMSKGMSTAFVDTSRTMFGFATKTVAIGGTIVGAFAMMGIKASAELETITQGFVGLLGGADLASKTMERIKKEAARTPFEIIGLSKATQSLASVTKNGDRAIDMVLALGESLTAMGRGQEELDRLSVNLQQIASVGRASMLDIKQFAFAGIPIFDMLAEATGKSGQALEEFISGGGVTFDMLEKMFKDATAEGGRFFGTFKNQTGTLNQLLSNLKDNFSILGSEIVNNTGLFKWLKDRISDVNNFLFENKKRIIDVINNGFKKLGEELKKLDEKFGITEKLKSLVQWAKNNKETILDFARTFGILAGVFITVGGAIMLLTNPVVQAIAIIGLLSVAFTYLKKKWDENAGGIQDKVNAVKEKFIEFKNKVIEAWNQIQQNESFKKFVSTVKEISSNIKTNLINTISMLKAKFEELKPKFEELWQKSKPFRDLLVKVGAIILGVVIIGVMKLWEIFTKNLAPALSLIIDIGVKVLGWFVEFGRRIAISIDFFRNLPQIIKDKWSEMKAKVSQYIAELILKFVTFVQQAKLWISTLPEKIPYYFGQILAKVLIWKDEMLLRIGEFINGVVVWFQELPNKISEKWEEIKTKAGEYWELIKAYVLEKGEQIKIWFNNLPSNIALAWETIKNKAVEKWEEIKNKIGEKKDEIIKFFKEDLPNGVSTGFDKVVETVKGIPNRIKEALNSVIGFFETMINGIIDGYNSVAEKAGRDTWSKVTLGRLDTKATGGISMGGSTLVGERGAEIVRLPKGASILNAQQSQGSGASVNITITGNTIDSSARIDEIVSKIKRELALDNQNSYLGLNSSYM